MSIKRYLYNALSLFFCLMQLLTRSRFDSDPNLLSISSMVWKANWTIYFVWLQWLCQKGKFDLWAVCQIIMKKFIILNDESNFMRSYVKIQSLFRIMKMFIHVHYIHVPFFVMKNWRRKNIKLCYNYFSRRLELFYIRNN